MEATMAGLARRTLLSAVAALLAVALLPAPSAAQAEPTAVPLLLDDPLGDVAFTAQGNPAPVGGTLYPGADLTSLRILEGRTSFTVTVGVAKLPTTQDPGMDGVLYRVFFTHNGREFALTYAFQVPLIDGQPNVFLDARDSPGGEFGGVWGGPVAVDTNANTITADVPRDVLADADGAAPYPGRQLEAIHAVASSTLSGADFSFFVPVTDLYEVNDAMPDDPTLLPSLPVVLGVQQSGTARLYSEAPFRASNGEATTFIYNVSVVNLAGENDSFELSASQVPAGYTLVLPVPFVYVEAGSAAQVPVLLTMPFGHQHGDLASFLLEAQSLGDPASIGRIEMGVRFLSVPQPAGHHDTVYLHSRPSGGLPSVMGFDHGYLNTLEQDPNDLSANLYAGSTSNTGPAEASMWWEFPLEPGLEMGLDVDSAKLGHLRLPMGTTVPLVQAKVEAFLYVTVPEMRDEDDEFDEFDFFDEQLLLAYMPETAPIDVTTGTFLVEGDLKADDDVRVPYAPGARLSLEVHLSWTGQWTIGLAKEAPYIAPGGSAVLPLREWHDSVDSVLATVGGPTMAALGPQERLVNPGEAVVFPVSVSNPLFEDVRLIFEVSGSNREWVTLPSESLVAPAHETVTASVVVRAPPGAVDQERADLVLMAYTEDHPEARGLLRLVAEVDTDEDQVDDTDVAEGLEKKDTPAFGPAVLLAVLALAALAFSRRR